MPVTLNQSRVTLREAWLTWKVHHAEFQAEVYRVEVTRLQAKIQRETDSVWKKTKAELIEMARQELGMTWASAEKETVATLREKIRTNRHGLKQIVDPLETNSCISMSGLKRSGDYVWSSATSDFGRRASVSGA